MFHSGNGRNSVKTVKISDKIEKINYTKWMIDSRCISQKMIHCGFHHLNSYDLKVRNLRYGDKIYAFDMCPSEPDFLQVPLLVEDDCIISAYQIALPIEYYENFLKKYLQISIDKIGSGVSDDLSKLVIELFNNLIEYGEAFPTKDMYWNQWHFDPLNFNEDYDFRNTKKVREEFEPCDLVKLIDNKKNKVYYGCLARFNKKEDYTLESFKCYYLDYNEFDEEKKDEIICFKFFLPEIDTGVIDLRADHKPAIELKKADMSELNDKQKEIYEIYSKHLFLR